MNIIIKDEERRRREQAMLREYGHTSNVAREQREYAECAAARVKEALEEMRRKSK